MAAHAADAAFTGWGRATWVTLLARLTDGFVRAIPAGGSTAAAHLPGARPEDRVPSIEGFARMAVAWGAWLHEPSNPPALAHDGRRHDVAMLLARGLADATDPRHPAWWGAIADRDQRIVEAAEVATALWLGGDRLRAAIDAVDDGAFERILDWLSLVDGRDVWPDNWVLFPMMSALARRWAGRPIPDETIDDAVDWMFERHVGDGWYTDGAGHALDLYTGWAIHWHLLWWATIDGARRPRRRAAVIRRARAWLASVAPLVAADGSFPLFGRSLGYRFALAAPFAQAALLGIDPLPPGVTRRLASGIVRHSLELGAIDHDTDWFRVGVGGERPEVVERYVSAGASAWAAHAFVALGMGADHPFWAEPEAGLPSDAGPGGSLASAGAGLLASWSSSTGETRLHNARSGHPPDIADHDYAASYGKLTYRSAFPFDLPVHLATSAAADSALVAAGSRPDRFAHRNESRSGGAGPGWIRSTYDLPTEPPTRVTTVVLVDDALEIRVSRVRPAAPVRIREGSAVLGVDEGTAVEVRTDDEHGMIALSGRRGVVAVRRLVGHGRSGCDETSTTRVNLVHDRACHPWVEEPVESVRTRIVAAATLAIADSGSSADAATASLREIRVDVGDEDEAVVTWPGAVAAISFEARPPNVVLIAGRTVRGPGLRIVRTTADGSSVAGERIESVDGMFALDRPGIVAVSREGPAVQATLETGLRLDPAWAGPGLRRLSVRTGAGPFAPVALLERSGIVPDALVRRLARGAGTRLITIRLDGRG
jgi:hypothetical protein